MELEKEITTTFENEYHKTIVNVVYTYGWLIDILKKRASKFHITTQQYNILRILRGQYPKPATINLLKERMLDKMSDASRIVERLVNKNLVCRTINQKDRRAVDILITEKGLELLKKMDKEMSSIELLETNITPAEAQQLNIILDKLRG
ncbi:MarR family winged helix-turn-helix transcriptional regulator [Rubrolithibacter danxiaensis]|uniref:MarR family winged helix-turn-helix transcriptional regulator n=1 Tax=Rubrolithibacter danxiaensis TaxID=3390805 RepID=UPI003BF81A75